MGVYAAADLLFGFDADVILPLLVPLMSAIASPIYSSGVTTYQRPLSVPSRAGCSFSSTLSANGH